MPTENQSQNRHPVDRLSDLRAQIKALQDEEKSLKESIMTDGNFVGDEFLAVPKVSVRKLLDRPLLEKKFGKDVIEECCKESSATTLNLFKKADIPVK